MKLAIISDTHFGDDNCTLVTPEKTIGTKYEKFKELVGQHNDFLVLAGDIFDFSIKSYDVAYNCGQAFLQQIKADGIADKIIYIPGNHDADIWHIVQHQKSVINKLENGDLPEKYDHSVAGIIDDRINSPTRGVVLDKTSHRTEGREEYGGMFLDRITKPETVFYFVYPNLYIVTANDTVLVTHGQYLESYWAMLGEVALDVAYDDLKVGDVDIEETIEMNYPLNQLACTGIGQAGVLTKVIRLVQTDVNNGRYERIERYMSRFEKVIEELSDNDIGQTEWFSKVIHNVQTYAKKGLMKLLWRTWGKNKILNEISEIGTTRYSEEFMKKSETKERFERFYNASLIEIGEINTRRNCNIPAPSRIIFGHTHQPIPWKYGIPLVFGSVSSASPKQLTLHNTGGWLMNNNKFCGAEVFLYDTINGFSSLSVT